MANRSFYPSQSYGLGRVYAEFLFLPNGASAPVASSFHGSDVVDLITNVPTHTGGTAIIGITLKDTFTKVIFAGAEVVDTAGHWATVGAITNEASASAIAFNIYFWVAAGTVYNDPALTTTVALAFANTNISGMRAS